MKLVITDISALDFYRLRYPPNRAPGQVARVTGEDAADLPEAEQCAYLESEVWSLAPEWVTQDFLASESGALHVLTRSASCRSRAKTVRTHTFTGDLPPGALFPCGEGVLVPSPEFVFVTMAPKLAFAELVALGYELCGLYSFDNSTDRGLRSRDVPLTTREKLRRFIAALKGHPGSRRAALAIDHVLERSASPMETAVTMQLCLPCARGGYGLPAPRMNHPLALNARARSIAGKGTCILDICWPDRKLLVEYNGGFDHTQRDAQFADRARINAIAEMGYDTVELTMGQVSSPEAFEAIALRLGKHLGKRIPTRARGRTPQRMQLRDELFAWNRMSGRAAREDTPARS